MLFKRRLDNSVFIKRVVMFAPTIFKFISLSLMLDYSNERCVWYVLHTIPEFRPSPFTLNLILSFLINYLTSIVQLHKTSNIRLKYFKTDFFPSQYNISNKFTGLQTTKMYTKRETPQQKFIPKRRKYLSTGHLEFRSNANEKFQRRLN